jgi:hypothetical protein
MPFQGIATHKAITSQAAIEFVIDGVTYSATYGNISGFTERRIENAVKAWANARGKTLPVFGIHKNRDGSICFWTGAPPRVWPEDMVY